LAPENSKGALAACVNQAAPVDPHCRIYVRVGEIRSLAPLSLKYHPCCPSLARRPLLERAMGLELSAITRMTRVYFRLFSKKFQTAEVIADVN
jgi:hypothetical protein